MTLRPEDLDGIEDKPVRVAASLERAVITFTRKWAIRKTPDEAGFLRRLARLVGVGLSNVWAAVRRALGRAARIGAATATADMDAIRRLARLAPKAPRNPAKGVTVRTPAELAAEMKDLAPGIVGSATGLYREIIRRIVANPPESEAARLRVAQEVLDDFERRGVTGFTDRAGRRWNLVSYIEMATRTAANEAATDTYLAQVAKAGHDIVRMSVVPNCSDLCAPFQGRLLSVTGATVGSYEGHPVVCSVAEAIARGYRHPGCRHILKAWFPGDPLPDPPPPDPQAYKDSQTLRRYEREVRAAKRAQAAAVTPEAKAAAGKAVRAAQARIREHVKATGQVRKREREQIDRVL